MPRSGEAGAGRSKPAESSAQPPPPAAATHAAGRKEGPPATNRFLLPASAGTLRTARARGSGRWARREAGSAQQRSGPAGPSGAGGARGRNTRAAPGAASPPPPRRPSAERPQPLPRGGPSRAANGSRQPRSHPSPRSGRPPARRPFPPSSPRRLRPGRPAARHPSPHRGRSPPPPPPGAPWRAAAPPARPPVPYSGARCSGSAAAAILNFQTPSLPLGRRGAAAHAHPGRREGLGMAGWRPPEANPARGAGCEQPAPPSAPGRAGGDGERRGGSGTAVLLLLLRWLWLRRPGEGSGA